MKVVNAAASSTTTEPTPSAVAFDLNELLLPSSTSLKITKTFPPHQPNTLSVVLAFITRPRLPAAPPAELPGDSNGSDCPTCGRLTEFTKQMVVCDGCERGFHLDCTRIRRDNEKQAVDVKVVDDWMCEECVSNAIPCDRWPLGFKVEAPGNKSGSFALPFIKGVGEGMCDLPNSRKHSPGDNTFGGDRFGVPVSYSKLLHGVNGSSFKDASDVLTPCFNFEEVNLHSRPEELSEVRKKGVNMQGQSPEEIQLEALREYVLERQGKLDEGWSVKLKPSRNSDEPRAFYCSPDGKTFRLMTEVACYLGLMPKRGRKRFNEEASLETGRVSRRRKSSLLSRDSGKSGVGVNVIGGDGSNNLDDTLPVQLEDFFILSFGKIDPRPAYHSVDRIWPVGYKSCWHDKITGSVFVCEVSEGDDSGPTFIVRRFSCSAQAIPSATTVIFRANQGQSDGKNEEKILDHDEDYNVTRLLAESSPPGEHDVLSCLNSSFNECPDLRTSNDVLPVNVIREDLIGEFSVAESSSSSVWRQVSKTFSDVCNAIYKEKGNLRFFCKHVTDVTHESCEDQFDPFAKFHGSMNDLKFPSIVQDDKQMNTCSEFLVKWLDQDRFGLDMEFVQEFVEQLPCAAACSEYVVCSERCSPSSSLMIGNGILQTKRKDEETVHTLSGGHNSPKKQMSEDIVIRCSFPPGKPICTRLPPQCVGNVLEAHEFLCRFHEILELQEPLSFEELEEELIHPCDKSISYALTKAHKSMLKVLVSEFQLRVSAVIDPNADGDLKPKRGRKKDIDMWTTSQAAKLDLVPINELTWPEMVHRYVLAFSSVGYDLCDISTHVAAKIFRCLQGDGGILCGSKTGVLGKEEDAKLLAGALKKIYVSSDGDGDILYTEGTTDESSSCANIGPSDFHVPDWVKVLEPVRKLPTNVGARIRNRIYEALKMGPPEWAKSQLEMSISKEVYKGNASGPTKQAVIEVLRKASATNMLPNPARQKLDRKERKKFALVSEIILKKCRIILRRSVSGDEKNINKRKLINGTGNDEEGGIKSAFTMSRPLDFRIIDLRLTAGAYGGSHEAFLEDVRELWNNRRIAHADQTNLLELAGELSSNFESLYQQEVLTLFRKLLEYSKLETLTADSKKDVEELLNSMKEIPKAFWEEGVCKVCGIDKDDSSVLLCDMCDAEYHTYCLNPPLTKIPEGNWYCPSCDIGGNSARDAPEGFRVEKITHNCFDSLTHLASVLEEKEYWELSAEERILVLKFLCDELLNSSLLRHHLEQYSETSSDKLIQQVCSLSRELKNLNSKEERLASRVGKVDRSSQAFVGDAPTVKEFSSAAAGTYYTFGIFSDNISRPECSRAKSVPSFNCKTRDGDDSTNIAFSKNGQSCQKKLSSDSCDVPTDEPGKHVESDNNVMVSSADMQGSLSPPHDTRGHDNAPHVDEKNPQLDNLELISVRKEIELLQNRILSIERQVLRLSLRKEFLGSDSTGRLYWGFSESGTHKIVVNDAKSSFCTWVSYQSDSDVDELVKYLKGNEPNGRKLRKSILDWQKTGFKGSRQREIQMEKPEMACTVPFTVAATLLQTKYGPFSEVEATGHLKSSKKSKATTKHKMFRCECLEPIWSSRHHCIFCHRTFFTVMEFEGHNDGKCSIVSSLSVKSTENAQEFNMGEVGKSQNDESCPFSFEAICSNFLIEHSNKQLVKEIGLIGLNGIPDFVPSVSSSYSTDPALVLASPKDLGLQSNNHAADPFSVPEPEKMTNASLKCAMTEVNEVKSTLTNIGALEVGSMSSGAPKYSSRPLVGKARQILKQLKVNLLDMEAALPEEGMRPFRASSKNRCAWRAFVKSAETIYEMVQATIVFEDMIKTEYLKKMWWHWSSYSAAARISTLSHLALRIYSLDAAIDYEKVPASSSRSLSQSAERNKPGRKPNAKRKEPEA